ncbi:MAG: UDP-N-acetylmuramate dehydrogenase, partial [Deltaproteobacteria bacterium]|nr:UDP-N-acetylmuramate dehydrogenase [Deltaproteobacteria bacterium]
MTAGPQGVEVLLAEPLAKWTTFRIGGPAEVLCLPRGLDQLRTILAWAGERTKPITLLGGGSNVLVSDQGLAGAVVVLREGFDQVDEQTGGRDRVRIKAGAGLKLARLTALAGQKGWADLVFLAGIPGTLGGATMMNAGTGQAAMDQVVRRLRVVDPAGRSRDLASSELNFSYRRLGLDPDLTVVEVELESRLAPAQEVAGRIKAALELKRQTQPLNWASAGSFFKNPPGDFAGRLIEAAGLKGARVGQAQVSEVHANFIVNLGSATAEEVLTLAAKVKREVKAGFQVELKPEVRF